MRPALKTNCPPNSSLTDTLGGSNGSLSLSARVAVANLQNVIGVQFSHWVLLAACASAMSNGVLTIRFFSVPSQIQDRVVRWIAVIMAALHSFRTGANKGFENKPVYPFTNHNSPIAKREAFVARFAAARPPSFPNNSNNVMATFAYSVADSAKPSPNGPVRPNHVGWEPVDFAIFDRTIILWHDSLPKAGCVGTACGLPPAAVHIVARRL